MINCSLKVLDAPHIPSPGGKGDCREAVVDEERRKVNYRKKPVKWYKSKHYCPHSSSVSLTLDSFPPGEAKAASPHFALQTTIYHFFEILFLFYDSLY